ncbi:hypothetical protein ACF0H5_006871 [Mactra antiquata]
MTWSVILGKYLTTGGTKVGNEDWMRHTNVFTTSGQTTVNLHKKGLSVGRYACPYHNGTILIWICLNQTTYSIKPIMASVHSLSTVNSLQCDTSFDHEKQTNFMTSFL